MRGGLHLVKSLDIQRSFVTPDSQSLTVPRIIPLLHEDLEAAGETQIPR